MVEGSAAAGFSATVSAMHQGLNVVVIEKAKVIGGSTFFVIG
ncbi:FAD-binding protein [Algicella marina]